MRKEDLMEYFLNIPVSINNLYGDPFYKDQIENTLVSSTVCISQDTKVW